MVVMMVMVVVWCGGKNRSDRENRLLPRTSARWTFLISAHELIPGGFCGEGREMTRRRLTHVVFWRKSMRPGPGLRRACEAKRSLLRPTENRRKKGGRGTWWKQALAWENAARVLACCTSEKKPTSHPTPPPPLVAPLLSPLGTNKDLVRRQSTATKEN